jgi:tetratricopeptide (TPR) repeat protein
MEQIPALNPLCGGGSVQVCFLLVQFLRKSATYRREAMLLELASTSAGRPELPVSTIISVAALIFSFGTTFVSYRRTTAQDIQALREELRTILQRLSAIPRENLDASKRYYGDQATIMAMSQLYNQENTLLARQAAEISKKLPKSMVSATEYAEIALCLQNAYNLAGAKEFYTLAFQSARDFSDEINAVRSLASLEFIGGQPQAGRVKYQEALNIFSKYPDYNEYTKVTTHVLTEIFWADAEANSAQLQLALQHNANAQQLLESLPFSPGAESFKRQVADQRAQFLRGSAAGSAAPTMPFPTQPMPVQHSEAS